DGGRHLPLAVRREHLHPYTRITRGVPFERTRCGGPAAHRDSLRRPGFVSRTQAALSRDLWTLAVSRARLHGAVRESEGGATRNRSHRHYVRSGGSSGAAGRAETG